MQNSTRVSPRRRGPSHDLLPPPSLHGSEDASPGRRGTPRSTRGTRRRAVVAVSRSRRAGRGHVRPAQHSTGAPSLPRPACPCKLLLPSPDRAAANSITSPWSRPGASFPQGHSQAAAVAGPAGQEASSRPYSSSYTTCNPATALTFTACSDHQSPRWSPTPSCRSRT